MKTERSRRAIVAAVTLSLVASGVIGYGILYGDRGGSTGRHAGEQSEEFYREFAQLSKRGDGNYREHPPVGDVQLVGQMGGVWHFGWFAANGYYCAGYVSGSSWHTLCNTRGYGDGDGKVSIVFGAAVAPVGSSYIMYGYIREPAVRVLLSDAAAANVVETVSASGDAEGRRFFIVAVPGGEPVEGSAVTAVNSQGSTLDMVKLWNVGPPLGPPSL
ncbi:hypothetical protein GCM10010440_70700 [Kitasatospora cinereorecta]